MGERAHPALYKCTPILQCTVQLYTVQAGEFRHSSEGWQVGKFLGGVKYIFGDSVK